VRREEKCDVADGQRTEGVRMLVEPDRSKRHRLFEFVNKPLDSFVSSNHLLRRVESYVDFRKISEPLLSQYHPDRASSVR